MVTATWGHRLNPQNQTVVQGPVPRLCNRARTRFEDGRFRSSDQRQGNANAFFDVIEMGANTRETELTIRCRGRTSPAVGFVSRRAWCRESGSPRSREASESNPWLPTRSNLQILSHRRERWLANAGERDILSRESRLSRSTQSGCEADKERFESPDGTWTRVSLLRDRPGARLDRFVERTLASGVWQWRH